MSVKEVADFEKELVSITESKPPVSASKIATLTKMALKQAKHYKNIIYSIEKFLQKSEPEYKLAGLYVLDSVARASLKMPASDHAYHKRVEERLESIFIHLLDAPVKDKEKMVKLLHLWKKSSTFNVEMVDAIEKAYFSDISVNPTSSSSHDRSKPPSSSGTGAPTPSLSAGLIPTLGLLPSGATLPNPATGTTASSNGAVAPALPSLLGNAGPLNLSSLLGNASSILNQVKPAATSTTTETSSTPAASGSIASLLQNASANLIPTIPTTQVSSTTAATGQAAANPSLLNTQASNLLANLGGVSGIQNLLAGLQKGDTNSPVSTPVSQQLQQAQSQQQYGYSSHPQSNPRQSEYGQGGYDSPGWGQGSPDNNYSDYPQGRPSDEYGRRPGPPYRHDGRDPRGPPPNQREGGYQSLPPRGRDFGREPRGRYERSRSRSRSRSPPPARYGGPPPSRARKDDVAPAVDLPPGPDCLPGYPDESVPLDSMKFLSRTLYVAGFAPHVTEGHLRAAFETVGRVQSITMTAGRPNAFVKVATRREAEAIRNTFKDNTFEGQPLRIGWGCGYGPRDAFNYEEGYTLFQISRMIDQDREAITTAPRGGGPVEGGSVVEEPDVPLSLAVSSRGGGGGGRGGRGGSDSFRGRGSFRGGSRGRGGFGGRGGYHSGPPSSGYPSSSQDDYYSQQRQGPDSAQSQYGSESYPSVGSSNYGGYGGGAPQQYNGYQQPLENASYSYGNNASGSYDNNGAYGQGMNQGAPTSYQQQAYHQQQPSQSYQQQQQYYPQQ